MERFDVAVVGGGPAGSAAAHAAASAGASAVVLEKGVPRADRPDRLGPDSTDAAGILDYWVDIMGVHPDEMPDDVVLGTLDRAEFIGPTASLTMESTGIDASYDHFGFCMHRARFDDWLRERATDAGADYRVGVSVTGVESDLTDSPRHTVRLANGEDRRFPPRSGCRCGCDLPHRGFGPRRGDGLCGGRRSTPPRRTR